MLSFRHLIIFTLYTGLIFSYSLQIRQVDEPNRYPSQSMFEGLEHSCPYATVELLKETLDHVGHEFKRIDGLKDLDFEKLDIYKKNFINGFDEEVTLSNAKVDSPTKLVAYLDALATKFAGNDISSQLKLLSFKEKKKFIRLLDNMDFTQNIDNLLIHKFVSDFYAMFLKKDHRLSLLFNKHKKVQHITIKAFLEMAAQKGIIQNLKDRGMYGIAGRFSRFAHSKKGRMLGTSLMNFPVYFGMPPMYLPRLYSKKISEDLFLKIIKEGSIEKAIPDIMGEWGLRDGVGNLYEVIRVNYNVAIMGYFTAYLVYELYQSILLNREITKTTKKIDKTQNRVDEVNKAFNDLDKVHENDKKIQEALENLSACNRIKDCLEKVKEKMGVMPEKGDEMYEFCKINMDPENECREY